MYICNLNIYLLYILFCWIFGHTYKGHIMMVLKLLMLGKKTYHATLYTLQMLHTCICNIAIYAQSSHFLLKNWLTRDKAFALKRKLSKQIQGKKSEIQHLSTYCKTWFYAYHQALPPSLIVGRP